MPRYDLKAYTSLTARIPQELADQVKRYAREHRCGLSELSRDGLEMRLEADPPWHAAARTRAPDAEDLQEQRALMSRRGCPSVGALMPCEARSYITNGVSLLQTMWHI